MPSIRGPHAQRARKRPVLITAGRRKNPRAHDPSRVPGKQRPTLTDLYRGSKKHDILASKRIILTSFLSPESAAIGRNVHKWIQDNFRILGRENMLSQLRTALSETGDVATYIEGGEFNQGIHAGEREAQAFRERLIAAARNIPSQIQR